jgi:hypothetical protein
MIHTNLSSPSHHGAAFPLFDFSIDRSTSTIEEPKTYTTQEIVDILGLPNAAVLHKSKNEDKPYIHQSSSPSATRIVLSLKRNTWMIFSPC